VTSVTFDVPINDDNTLEHNEDFSLTIVRNALPDGVTHGSTSQTTVTIVDDDGKGFTHVTNIDYPNSNVYPTTTYYFMYFFFKYGHCHS